MELFKLFGDILINDEASKVIDKVTEKAKGLASGLGEGVATAAKWTAGIAAAGAAAIGVVGAGLLKLSSDTAATADRIDKLSIRLGISRESFQEWDYILAQSGSNIEGLQIGMKTLTQRIDEANTKGSEGSKAFKELGISIKEGMSQEEVFKKVIFSLQNTEDQLKKTTIAETLLGRAGQDLLPLLNTTAKDTDNLRESFKKLGLQMSDNAVSAGVKFGDTMDDVKKSLGKIKDDLGTQVMPIMQKFLDLIIKNMPTIRKVIELAFSAIEIAVLGFMKTFNMVSKIFEENWNDWAIIALESSNYVLKVFKNLIDGLNELLKNNSGTLEKIKNAFITSFNFVADLVFDFWNWLKKLWNDNSSDVIDLTKQLLIVFDNFAISVKALWDILSSTEALAIYKRTFESIRNFAETYISVTIDWIQLLIALMTVDFEKAGEEFQSIIKKTFSGAEKIVKPYFEDIKLIFSFLWDDYIQPPLEYALEKTIEFVKEVPTKIKEAGENIVIGLGDGISSKAGYAIDKMKDVGSGIVDKVTGIFDIQSPSKLMEKFGGYITEGLGIGVEDGKENLLEKTSDTLQSIIDATDATIAKLKNEKTGEKIISALTPSEQEKADYEQGYADYYANLEKLAQEDLKRREENKDKRVKQTKSEVLTYEEEYNSFYENLGNKITTKGQEIAESLSGFMNKYGGLITALGDAIGGKFGDVTNAVMAGSDVAVKALSGDWAGAATSLIQNWGTIEQGFKSLMSAIFGESKSTSELVAESWEDLANQLDGIFKTFAENTGNIFVELIEKFEDAYTTRMTNLADNAKKEWENISGGAKNAVAVTTDAIATSYDKVVYFAEGISNNLTTVLNRVLGDQFTSQTDKLRLTVELTLTSFDELASSIFKSLGNNSKLAFDTVQLAAEDMYAAVKPLIEELTGVAISEADKLGRATIDALKTKYEEEEKQRLESIDKDKKALAEKTGIEATTAKASLETDKKYWEEKLGISINNYDELSTVIKNYYNEKKKAENLENEALKLATAENQDELIALLETYNPKWQDVGQSFGEKLVTGLNSMKETIKDSVTGILNLVTSAQDANKKLGELEEVAKGKIKTLQEISAETGKIGLELQQTALNLTVTQGGIGQSGQIQRGQEIITQNITIISPDTTDPLENARQIKNASMQLMLS